MKALTFELAAGSVTVQHAAGPILEGHGEVRLADGRVLDTRTDPPELVWSAQAVEGAVILRIAVHNSTSRPIQVEQLTPLMSPTGYRRLPAGRLRVGQMGWQSWSQPHPPRPFEPNLELVDTPCRSPFMPGRWPDSELAPSMAVLSEPGGESLLLGFVSGRDLNGAIEIAVGELGPAALDGGGEAQPAMQGHRLRGWSDGEGLTVEPGATLESEPLLIAAGDEGELLDYYARAVAERMAARHWPRVPTGWCSWYHFFTWVTEDDCRRNLEVLAHHRDELPMEVFQLDDGYQQQVGDWLALNDKFPNGMPALTAAIRDAGFTPGIWLAPFLLSASSKTYAEHPDWVVRGDDGTPIDVMSNWGSENYALDTTQPDAMAWLEHVVRTMCEDWGHDYLKIDFVYAAAVRGRRFDARLSGVQAYRRGVEMIRRVAGERFILGCGAPFLPSVGLVDGMRIGEDVAPFWRREGNAPGPAMTNALHSTLLHNWMHRRWWVNDPDCVMVRDNNSQLTLAEVQAWAGVVALSGGMVLVSDDLSNIEPERLHLLARLYPPLGEPSSAHPPYAGDMPERLRLSVRRPWGEWHIVGLANWSDEERRVRYEPDVDGPYHLVDLWTGAHLGPLTGPAEFRALAPHEMLLLSVHPAVDRPQVVGSTGHLLGDAMDVEDESWDGSTLTIKLASSHEGELLLYFPAGQRLERIPFPLSHWERAGVRVS